MALHGLSHLLPHESAMPGIVQHHTLRDVDLQADPQPASSLPLSIFPVIPVQLLQIAIPPGKLLQLPRPRRAGQSC